MAWRKCRMKKRWFVKDILFGGRIENELQVLECDSDSAPNNQMQYVFICTLEFALNMIQ